MYDSIEEVNALIDEAFETVSLEFKNGAKLNNPNDRAKADIVTDVTAFANAGGGTLIYGIQEEEREGKSFAASIAPVTDLKMSVDRLRDIITSNTDPVLHDFKIDQFVVDGGSIFVVHIDQGDTAYQNRRDHRFYTRMGASAQAMFAFSIRDVMNRRTRPHVVASFQFTIRVQQQQMHEYVVRPTLKNDGSLTAHHWALRVGLPDVIGSTEGRLVPHIRRHGEDRLNGVPYTWYQYQSERGDGGTRKILPGDSLDLAQELEYAGVVLVMRMGSQEQMRLMHRAPPLRWELLVDDSRKIVGEVPFEEWCRF